jgi:hypothetical protein
MKVISLLLLILLSSINTLEYTGHDLVLNDAKTTIDGETVSSTPKNGVSYKNSVLTISESGTYILSGTLNGQLSISVAGEIDLIFNGATIKTSSTNALVVLKAYEMDTSSSMTPSTARKLDFSKAGVKIIIADGSTNTISGAKSSSYDGAIHTAVTILFTGETKGDGVLNVIGTSEGIEVERHLCVSGGVLNVAAQDDGINAKTDNVAVVFVKGGKVLVNSGLGSEGDGIDSNGYIFVEGGEIISSAKPNADSGLDSNKGIYVDGGRVYATGSSMDMAESGSAQPTMNLIFNTQISASQTVVIKDSSGNEVISFCANKADFISGTSRKAYKAAIVTDTTFKAKSVYHLYVDGVQYGYTSNDKPGPWGSSEVGATVYADFTLGTGATYYSGIQKK